MSSPSNPIINPEPEVYKISDLDQILNIISTASSVAQGLTSGQTKSVIALEQSLLGLVQAGVSAFENIAGKPLDLTLLHQIEPLPINPDDIAGAGV